MKKINLPKKFQNILKKDTVLFGLVYTALGEFGPWLERNNVKFFTEYTEHSINHIEDILSEAENLVRKQSLKLFTPADVAALTLATLLHDCAMHLSIDGFIELIQSKDRQIIKGFNDKPWAELWSDFYAEARKFSGRKLIALFGNTEPVEYPRMISQEMTGRDLLLIGEFLRRHHHRLAHEIALWGVPGPTNQKLHLITSDETKYILDLAGLIARSHGLNLRDTIDYLRLNYGSEKKYKDIHLIFVMVLLRVSDIMQIQASRAPKQIEKVEKFQSPVSIVEWEMHDAIKSINKNYDESETITITAHPTKASTYLRIRKMLDQIQNELDVSWTILSEVYGFIPQLDKLGLSYRRVKSNIDDLDTFSTLVNYIPIQASFEVADTDLLKLLIGPLYGHRPEIGIRELIQNAVDAVRELREYQKQYPETKNIDLTQQESDVVISIYKDDIYNKWWLKVSDCGIGMTAETVRDYFLRAGASLRKDEIWRETFEDSEGNSKVLRSGRFGIGALATFLLGDKISLSTRYVNSDPKEGIEFTAKLDTEFIELRRVERPVGTTICISISEETKNILSQTKENHDGDNKKYWTQGDDWDWYYLSEPKISRFIEGNSLVQKHTLPSINSDLPVEWRRIYHPDYEDIQWTYWDKLKKYDNKVLICNGIIIEDKFTAFNPEEWLNEKQFINGYIAFDYPIVSMFDPNAKLPLNLQRTKLIVDYYPFQKQLQESVLKDFIAYMLTNAPTKPLDSLSYRKLIYPGISARFNRIHEGLSFFFSTKEGIGLQGLRKNISKIKVDSSVIIFNYTGSKNPKRTSKLQAKNFFRTYKKSVLFYNYNIHDKSTDRYIDDQELLRGSKINNGFDFAINFEAELNANNNLSSVLPKRILISRQALSLHSKWKKSKKELILRIGERPASMDDFIEEWSNKDWIILKKGDCPDSQINLKDFALRNQNPNIDIWPCLLVEFYYNIDADPQPSLLENLWDELLGDPIIPYDLKKRRAKFNHTYNELKDYIQAHEKLKLQEDY